MSVVAAYAYANGQRVRGVAVDQAESLRPAVGTGRAQGSRRQSP